MFVYPLGIVEFTWAMKKEPGLFSVQKGIILSSYVGIIINHYKDPKKSNQDSMKCVLFFFSWLGPWPGCATRWKTWWSNSVLSSRAASTKQERWVPAKFTTRFLTETSLCVLIQDTQDSYFFLTKIEVHRKLKQSIFFFLMVADVCTPNFGFFKGKVLPRWQTVVSEGERWMRVLPWCL